MQSHYTVVNFKGQHISLFPNVFASHHGNLALTPASHFSTGRTKIKYNNNNLQNNLDFLHVVDEIEYISSFLVKAV